MWHRTISCPVGFRMELQTPRHSVKCKISSCVFLRSLDDSTCELIFQCWQYAWAEGYLGNQPNTCKAIAFIVPNSYTPTVLGVSFWPGFKPWMPRLTQSQNFRGLKIICRTACSHTCRTCNLQTYIVSDDSFAVFLLTTVRCLNVSQNEKPLSTTMSVFHHILCLQ